MAARLIARVIRREARREASTPVLVQWEEPIPIHKFEGRELAIRGFVFLHDGIHIVSGSGDGTMHKWNYNTGLVIGEPWRGEGGGIGALALSPGGNIIVCGRGDGCVQRWTTDGEMIEGVWTGHSKAVRSLSWSPSGSHIASGSEDGTILIRRAESGGVEVGPIYTEQIGVWILAYSPSGESIASGGGQNHTICIWDTKTGKLVVGPIQDMGFVTSLLWSPDNTNLYSASDKFACVFNSKSGTLLHRLKRNNYLYHSIALSPKQNILACMGISSVTQLWDMESHQQLELSQPFKFYQEHHGYLICMPFSLDEKYIAYSGDSDILNRNLTLWVFDDTAPQLSTSTPPQQSDRQSTQQETRSNSPTLSSSSFLDADATGGDEFIEDTNVDPYNNFFQLSQQSLPSPLPGFHFSPLFSARRLWNVISRRHPPPDQSVPQKHSKRGFFSRRVRSKLSLELTAMTPNQPVPEGEMGEAKGEDHASAHDPVSTRMDQGEHCDDSPADARNPTSCDRTPSTQLNSEDHRTLWQRLIQPPFRPAFGSPYPSSRLTNGPQPGISRNSWHWTSSLFSARSSGLPVVNIAACRDEDRYGITPETDAEAAAAMLRTNDDVADHSTRPGDSGVVTHLFQGRPTHPQASTIVPQEIEVSCCGFSFSCRRHSNQS